MLARDAKLEDYPPVTILHAVAAQIAVHQGDRPRAKAELTRAQRLRPGLTYPRLVHPAASALTAAELRLLPMLTTHLSFPEIAEEMVLSPNTVKSQAMSIYHKLGASSRNQTVTRSRQLGLLEG